MLDELQTAYGKNTRFRRYVDRYCVKYPGDITVNEALTHELVRQVYLEMEDDEAAGVKNKHK